MTARWRGLTSLLGEIVEHGSRAVERIQKETVARPLAIAAAIPPLAPLARVVSIVHDVVVSTTHGAIRVGGKVVTSIALAALDDDKLDQQNDDCR